MGTPPRPSADPGSQVDSNFVSEDWDEDDDIDRHNYSSKEREANHPNKRQPSTSGVSSDPNWLEENFDD